MKGTKPWKLMVLDDRTRTRKEAWQTGVLRASSWAVMEIEPKRARAFDGGREAARA